MFISGSKAKEELAANSRVVGANGNIKVVFDGGELDGSSGVDEINLPDIPANAKIDNTKMRELRGLADHESFHARYTPLARWAEIAKYCSASGDAMSMGILNGAEDIRIERLGMREFPGVKHNLQATVNRAIEIQAEGAENVPDDDWVGFLSLVITWEGRSANGLDITLPPVLAKFADKFDGLGITELYESDTFDGQLEVMANYLNDVWKLPTLRNYLDGVEPEKKDEQKQEAQGDGSDSKGCKGGKAGDGGKGSSGISSIGLDSVMDDIGCEFPYFGDQDQIRHEKIEPTIDGQNPMDWADTYGLGEGLVQSLKDQLSKRYSAGRKSALLDNKRLVNAFNREEKIWKNKKELERGYNTAVSFIVDWSMSMSGRSKEMLAITTSLARGISQVGIPLEITGFTEIDGKSTKKHCIRSGALMIYHAKEFDNPLDFRRIAGLRDVDMGFTPDTEALQLGVERISKRKEGRKVVIILTDGGSQPAYRGTLKYRGKTVVADRRIYSDHLTSILEQAEKDGVEVYSIALGNHPMDEYRDDRVLRVKNVGQLEARIFRMFFDVIARRGQ